MPEIIHDKIVKARKKHTCFWCRTPIPIGTLYSRSDQHDGYRIYAICAHQCCRELVDDFFREQEIEDGLSSHDFLDLVREDNNHQQSGIHTLINQSKAKRGISITINFEKEDD